MSRFLLLPANNTLSHIGKCLSLRTTLEARGHEVLLAVSASRAATIERLGQTRYVQLPDIQEADGATVPSLGWFRPQRFEACVRAEVDLLKRLRPDRVLGVFRFSGPLSARLAEVPYDALICGAMTPACDEVLGFAEGEPGAQEQAAALTFFRQAGARRLGPALKSLGLPAIDDLWQLLAGQRTWLWDFPEFQPLPATPGYRHVGPLSWSGWPRARDTERLAQLRGPVALLAFGTGRVDPRLLRHLIETLWLLGYSVALALGGQEATDILPPPSERLAIFDFLPADQALPQTALVVCHGGQMLIFEAMQRGIPVFVLPLQPEQAQNGRCLERLGCGQRLLRGQVYRGGALDSERACLAQPVATLAEGMAAFLAEPATPARLNTARETIASYAGVETLADALEQSA